MAANTGCAITVGSACPAMKFGSPASSGRLESKSIMRKSLDLTHRAMSDFAIHPTADITGEADSRLSTTALKAAAAGGREAIIDKGGPLAKRAAKR